MPPTKAVNPTNSGSPSTAERANRHRPGTSRRRSSSPAFPAAAETPRATSARRGPRRERVLSAGAPSHRNSTEHLTPHQPLARVQDVASFVTPDSDHQAHVGRLSQRKKRTAIAMAMMKGEHQRQEIQPDRAQAVAKRHHLAQRVDQVGEQHLRDRTQPGRAFSMLKKMPDRKSMGKVTRLA